MKRINKLLSIFFIFVISSCSVAREEKSVSILITPTSVTTDQFGYIAPNQSDLREGYPAEENKISLKLIPGQLPESPKSASEPEVNKGSISGVIFSFTTNLILAKTMFYLTPAMGPDDSSVPPALFGPQVKTGDIVGLTDDRGIFNINNIPPGKYFLIVEAPMNWTIGLVSSEDPEPRLLTIESGQEYPLGIVFVSWP